jgi:hypothetical protein
MRLDANKFASLQIELRYRRRSAFGHAKWPQWVCTAADSTLEPVIGRAHYRTDSQPGFSDGSPDEVHEPSRQLR